MKQMCETGIQCNAMICCEKIMWQWARQNIYFISHKLIKKQAKKFILEEDKMGCNWLRLACFCMLLPTNKSNWEDPRWINSSVLKSTLGQNKLIHCIWRVNYLCRRYPKAEMARPCTSFDRIIIIVLSDATGREDVDSWGHTQKDHNINIKKNNKIAILLWIFSSNQLTSNQPLFVEERFLHLFVSICNWVTATYQQNVLRWWQTLLPENDFVLNSLIVKNNTLQAIQL